jgi:phage tail sheath protein FI
MTPPNYPDVYVEELPPEEPAIAGVSTAVTAFVGAAQRGPVNRPVRVLSLDEFAGRFGGLAATHETGYAVRQFFQNGGREAWVVRVARQPSLRQLDAGLRALDAVDLFNLLVLPGTTAPAAIALALAYCERRRAFLLVDPPASATTPAEIQGAAAAWPPEVKSHAAIYHPWLRIADPLHPGQTRLAPPSGTIAGLIARTDAARGVWKAPAGLDAKLEAVVALDRVLTDAESGPLNARGINCLRSFPTSGFVAWGARTLAGDDRSGSEFKYIPVRRTALFIGESVARGTKWALFEPNDEPLWARLRQSVGAFLHGLFLQGAFQGATPRAAYFVKCGRDTTTPADIGSGIVHVEVGFAPLKPAEFVVIRIRLSAGQSSP